MLVCGELRLWHARATTTTAQAHEAARATGRVVMIMTHFYGAITRGFACLAIDEFSFHLHHNLFFVP